MQNGIIEAEEAPMPPKLNHMPESLLWLSNELYWKQNLAPLAPAPPQPSYHGDGAQKQQPPRASAGL